MVEAEAHRRGLSLLDAVESQVEQQNEHLQQENCSLQAESQVITHETHASM